MPRQIRVGHSQQHDRRRDEQRIAGLHEEQAGDALHDGHDAPPRRHHLRQAREIGIRQDHVGVLRQRPGVHAADAPPFPAQADAPGNRSHHPRIIARNDAATDVLTAQPGHRALRAGPHRFAAEQQRHRIQALRILHYGAAGIPGTGRAGHRCRRRWSLPRAQQHAAALLGGAGDLLPDRFPRLLVSGVRQQHVGSATVPVDAASATDRAPFAGQRKRHPPRHRPVASADRRRASSERTAAARTEERWRTPDTAESR